MVSRGRGRAMSEGVGGVLTGVENFRNSLSGGYRHQSEGSGLGSGENESTRKERAMKLLGRIANAIAARFLNRRHRREPVTNPLIAAGRASQYSINSDPFSASNISRPVSGKSRGCPSWAAPLLVGLFFAVLTTLMYRMFHR